MSEPPAIPPSVAGRATGIGSWPGEAVFETMRTVLGELGDPPGLPYLPELPARGPGSDMVGRAASMLVDLPVDLQPSGWRLVDRPGRDLARSQAWLRQDLDVLAEVADGYSGDLKLQICGPWTLASQIWLPRLERAVVDPGACRDLIDSLAEGIRRHVEEVRRLLPAAAVIVQVDEPSISGVLAGELPTASGFGRIRSVDEAIVVDGLRSVLSAAVAAGAVGTVVHSCATQVPIDALVRAGAGALSLDVRILGAKGWQTVGEVVDGAGVALWAGVVPSLGAPGSPQAIADAVIVPWTRLGLDPSGLAAVVVTPTCGFAGSTPAIARSALVTARGAAKLLAERAES